MLLVKTKIGPSSVHGIGLFADEFIAKGTPTWRFEPWFDVSFKASDLEKMSEGAREQILWYAFLDDSSGNYVLCSDDQRFINHSANSTKINIETTPHEDVANRDIQSGEELLCDYNKFDKTYFTRLGYNTSALN